jgi:threonine/homoserine/homoserine lactone efflux protein
VHSLAIFFMVSLLSTATPGPSILYVTSQGVSGGLRAAIPSSLGILAADAFYVLLSITGLTAVLVASYELFLVIKWVGAIYLVYLGLRLVRAGLTSAANTGGASGPSSTRNAFLGGFVLHASNPKAMLYFGSIVPQFVDQSRQIAGQLLAMTVVHLITATMVLVVYSVVSARFRGSATNAMLRRVFHVATGSLFIGAGVSLMFARKAAQ